MNSNSIKSQLKQHHRDAFIWARHCCNYNTEDAQEVVQIVYLKIMEGKAVYRGSAQFKTWLFSVIRYSALDYLKSKVAVRETNVVDESMSYTSENEDIDYEKLLSHLSSRQRQVLLLCFYHGMTLEDVAEVTGLHIGTVRTHYERGKQGLKKLILKEMA